MYIFSKDIQREEEKVKRSIKDAAKKGQKDVCIILAKEMIHSKKAVNKLYASKAQMNSVLLSMKNQLCECSFILQTQQYALYADGKGKKRASDPHLFFKCVQFTNLLMEPQVLISLGKKSHIGP